MNRAAIEAEPAARVLLEVGEEMLNFFMLNKGFGRDAAVEDKK